MKRNLLIIALAAFTITAMISCKDNSQSKADAVLENIHYGKW